MTSGADHAPIIKTAIGAVGHETFGSLVKLCLLLPLLLLFVSAILIGAQDDGYRAMEIIETGMRVKGRARGHGREARA